MRVYVGYDPREEEACDVCVASLKKTKAPIEIVLLQRHELERDGIYDRPFTVNEDGQRIDDKDGKPFSTEFSFTRFLVPAMNGYQDWAMFVDCDFLFPEGIDELIEEIDGYYAVMCVKHDQDVTKEPKYKMDHCLQTAYKRKNWSSLMLWNCGHKANAVLTPDIVSTESGAWLHGMSWLKDGLIGALPSDWNFLVGVQRPRGIHYTLGGPWMDVPEMPFFDDWRNFKDINNGEETLKTSAKA